MSTLSTGPLIGLDELTKFAASMPGLNERARNSALSSIGWNLKSKARKLVASNSLGWPNITNLTRTTQDFPAVSATDNRRVPSRSIAQVQITRGVTRKIWGSLAPLLVYSLEKESGVLLFGFVAGTFGTKFKRTRSDGTKVRVDNVIGQDVVDLAKRLTEGFTHQITTKAQQRYYAALGFIFRMGTILKTPARPIVGPTFQAMQPQIPAMFAEKFWERLRSYDLGKLEKVRIGFFGKERKAA